MDEDVLSDLKQFISATVKQESAGLEQRLTEKIDTIDTRINKVLSAVAAL